MFSKIAIIAIFSALISCDAAVIRKRTLPTDMALQDTSSGLCLSNYAADDQLYSGPNDVPNVFSLTSDGISLFDVLTDTTVGKFCVGSEGGGTANQFQCSGDADSVSGGGQEFSYEPIFNYLTYKNDATFYACGDATTGVNYFARVRLGIRSHLPC